MEDQNKSTEVLPQADVKANGEKRVSWKRMAVCLAALLSFCYVAYLTVNHPELDLKDLLKDMMLGVLALCAGFIGSEHLLNSQKSRD